jgi:predicted RNA-binding protein with PUA-like domain
MTMAYWVLRSEPDAYSWDDLLRDGATEWNGVRNYTARNFLKEMAVGDEALFYHSNTEKAAVGIMAVTRTWQPDGDDGKWASVAVKPVRPLAHPVTLVAIKAEPKLAELMMLKQSRLSVSKVEPEEWKLLLKMAEG